MPPQLKEKLLLHSWKGNIRELKNYIEKLCILSKGEVLEDVNLPSNLENNPIRNQVESLNIEKTEKKLILEALKKFNNNKSLAAKELGISRRTLYRKIETLNLQ